MDIKDYEYYSTDTSESKNSIDQMELPFETNKEQQLPLIENFNEPTFQPIPMGLELQSNSESKTYLDNDEIEVGGSNQDTQDKQEPLFQTEKLIFKPDTTTRMQNDDKELGETFSCVYFIRMKLTFFLWFHIFYI